METQRNETHTDDPSWMTYEEAARVLGIAKDSVQRQAQRHGWPRMMGNDKRALVQIPPERIPEPTAPVDRTPALAELLDKLIARALAAEARAAAAEAVVAVQARELRRWVRRSPARHASTVIRRLDRLAKGEAPR